MNLAEVMMALFILAEVGTAVLVSWVSSLGLIRATVVQSHAEDILSNAAEELVGGGSVHDGEITRDGQLYKVEVNWDATTDVPGFEVTVSTGSVHQRLFVPSDSTLP